MSEIRDPSEKLLDDDALLEKMGYSPTLYRGLGAFMNFAFGFTEVAVLASVVITYGFGLGTGGPRSIIWGFLLNFFMTIFIAFSMAEICAAYPSAGSVYHWAGQLAPEKWAPLAAYITGWTNFLGNAAGDASFANGFATFMSSAMVASGYSKDGFWTSNGMQVAVSIVVLLVWSLLNCVRIDQVGWVNAVAAGVQVASLVIIVVVLLVLSPRLATANYVFFDYYNDTGFPSQTYVTVLGMTAALFSFSGYEASAHMAEETSNSSESAPNGIIYTVFATGIGGVALLLGLLFASTNIPVALSDDDTNTPSADTGNAAVNVFILATGPRWGETLAWMVVVNLFFAGVASVTVTGEYEIVLCPALCSLILFC